ncbi:hypothetical protein ABKV19_015697 [Rosa sericea]
MSRKHLPVFSKLLRVFIFIAKVRKLSFEKYYSSLIRKSQKNRKKLRFMEHYNYGFLGEYEFSPSNNTPLIRYPRKQFAKNRGSRELESLFFLCRCWGSLRVLEGEDHGDFAVEALPASSTGTEDANALALLAPSLDWGSEEASIDLRAQRFIERFYEDMRMQRQESI